MTIISRLAILISLFAHTSGPYSPYIKTFAQQDVNPTKSGWAYWFIPSGSVADTLSIKVSYVDKGKATHAPHSHMHDEIFIVIEGDVIVNLNGEETVLHPGDGMYAPSGSQHGIRRYDETKPVKYFVINRETPGGVDKPFPFREENYTMEDCCIRARKGTFAYITRGMSLGSMEMTASDKKKTMAAPNDDMQTAYIVIEGKAGITVDGAVFDVPAFSTCYVPAGHESSIKADGRFIRIRTR